MAKAKPKEKMVCGLVMPIAEWDGCSVGHWLEVRGILSEAIEDAGFTPQLVSDAKHAAVIQRTIVKNLFELPIIVCDLSGRNPNVMTELGFRLAFDKATVLVKDDATPFSFDTGMLEHLPYRRDLRYAETVQFKESLTQKLKGTYAESLKPGFSQFLQDVGPIQVPTLETQSIPGMELILKKIEELRSDFGAADRTGRATNSREHIHLASFDRVSAEEAERILLDCVNQVGVQGWISNAPNPNRSNLFIYPAKRFGMLVRLVTLLEKHPSVANLNFIGNWHESE